VSVWPNDVLHHEPVHDVVAHELTSIAGCPCGPEVKWCRLGDGPHGIRLGRMVLHHRAGGTT
jgi:hypothetical protein